MADLVERLRVKGPVDGERMNHTWRRLHIERLEAADEIERLRAVLYRAAFSLSRAADACSDGDLSDPRIDELSDCAIQLEDMIGELKES